MENFDVIIIGAGPAGLTSAYHMLKKKDLKITILEQDSRYVGGISRTEEYKNYKFDIGGHRFFSKSREIVKLWNEILPEDFILRPRKSRILYKGKFYSYPLKAFEAFINLGIIETFLCITSYIKMKIFPIKNPKTFHEWVANNFGERLFQTFFKSYTEKVWGISCDEISADWASQRIKNLNLVNVILTAVQKSLNITLVNKKSRPKTLIESFYYPRKGPGMMWEKALEIIIKRGGTISMGSKVCTLEYINSDKIWKIKYKKNQQLYTIYSKHIVSSMPIIDLLSAIKPLSSKKYNSDQLKYRDYITVVLIINGESKFDDNWIYIHDPNVKVGRIQNYKSWSPEMIPNDYSTCLGLEYFCNENDDLWNKSDSFLIKKAKEEIVELNLCHKKDIFDFFIVRQKKAYPVYDEDYQSNIDIIKKEIDKKYPNLNLVGRNGMHKYNNQDHAMMTGLLTAENILNNKKLFDVWGVNEDAEYQESGFIDVNEALGSTRQTPNRI